jgi:molybdate transport system ATP-binding protein
MTESSFITYGNNSDSNGLGTGNFLIDIINTDVSFQGEKALSNVNWRLKQGEHWAFIGPNGAGKTTLLRLIHGDIWPDSMNDGKRIYSLNEEQQESPIGVKKSIAIVSSELQDAYIRNNWNMSGEEVIYSGFFDSIWLYEMPDKHQRETAERVIDLLQLQDLRHKGILAMSHGEARKILIARALVVGPQILILDEFCNGLDVPSRKKLLHFIDSLTRTGTQILYATHRTEELIPSLTHYLYLKDGTIVGQGRKDALSSLEKKTFCAGANSAPVMGSVSSPALPSSGSNGNFILQIDQADVFFGNNKVLHDINWSVNTGENWAILGKNGAGKSTLLKLIAGGIHPAWGGKVQRFGLPELTSLWDIRNKIGMVTSEIQAAYTYDITGIEVIQSGFYSSIGFDQALTKEQQDIARTWIDFFSLATVCQKSMLRMSYGEQRKILIARAMVNKPHLLILDEPCSGLDSTARSDFLDTLEKLSSTGTNIIMITHHLDELIPSITHVLIMDRGSIYAQGKKHHILKSKKLCLLFEEADVAQ